MRKNLLIYCFGLVFGACCLSSLSTDAADLGNTEKSSTSTIDSVESSVPPSKDSFEKPNSDLPLTGGINESTSVLPPFQLHTLHSEIWAPVKSNSIMKGVYDQGALTGSSSLTAPGALTGQASTSFLQGRVIRDGEGAPLSTVQRLIRPRILTGYTMMRPSGIEQPDLFRLLTAQQAKAKPTLDAEIDKARKQMDAQLAHVEVPKFPNLSPVIAVKSPPVTRVETPRRDVPDPMLQAEIDQRKKQMDWQLLMSKRRITVDAPGVGNGPPITFDIDSQLARNRQAVDAQMELASKQLKAEMSRATPNVVADLSSENTQIELARKQTQAEIAKAKPALDAVLTKMRLIPQISIPSTDAQISATDVDAEMSSEKVIQWDLWYKKVASLYEPKLLKAIKNHANAEGSNTVSVTVTANHRVQVSISEPDNSVFDTATLEAYRALDGNPALQFPAGSHRQQVSFLIDNKHNNPAPVSRVSSQTYTGDKEVQGFKWKPK